MPKRSKRTTEADRISAMVWAKGVEIATNGWVPYTIELKFMPEDCFPLKGGQKTPPKLMNRYAAGKLSPKRRGKKCGGLDFVDRINTEFPGTSKWLYLPLWDLLQPTEWTLAELHEVMLQQNVPFVGKFFPSTDWPEKTFVRNFNSVQISDINAIATHHSIDAFTFLLGLIREAEIRMDVLTHFNACKSMKAMFPAIAAIPQMQPIAGRLFDYLEATFFRKIYNDPEGAELFFADSWRDQFKELALAYPAYMEANSDTEPRQLLSPVRLGN